MTAPLHPRIADASTAEPSERPDEGLPEYAGLLAARHTAHEPELRQLIARHWEGENLSILDVACGDAFYAATFDALLAPEGRITAVDISGAFLGWAARCVSETRGTDHRVVFLAADAERLPFPDGAFDLAWCAQSLISLPEPVAALREMRRVVRPGGTVGILENDRLHEMQLPWPTSLELALREAERRTATPEEAGEKAHAGRHLETLLREAGLTPKQRVTVSIDRRAPLPPADESFIQIYLHSLIGRTAGTLAPGAWDELRNLAEPDSPGYLPARPDFWMTWTDVVVLAARD